MNTLLKYDKTNRTTFVNEIYKNFSSEELKNFILNLLAEIDNKEKIINDYEVEKQLYIQLEQEQKQEKEQAEILNINDYLDDTEKKIEAEERKEAPKGFENIYNSFEEYKKNFNIFRKDDYNILKKVLKKELKEKGLKVSSLKTGYWTENINIVVDVDYNELIDKNLTDEKANLFYNLLPDWKKNTIRGMATIKDIKEIKQKDLKKGEVYKLNSTYIYKYSEIRTIIEFYFNTETIVNIRKIVKETLDNYIYERIYSIYNKEFNFKYNLEVKIV